LRRISNREALMRIPLVLGAALAALLTDVSAGQTYSDLYRRFPWCAVQNMGFGTVTRSCYYANFENCRREVVAGNRGTCEPNSYYWAYRAAQPEVADRPVRRARRAR
jgi:hypothetical protein